MRGPRRTDEADGPDEVHLVILDNGRVAQLAGPLREALYCLRCGACLTSDERHAWHAVMASADMGLTGVDLAIAETGTLILASGPGRSRAAALLPRATSPCSGPVSSWRAWRRQA